MLRVAIRKMINQFSREAAKSRRDIERLSALAVGGAYRLHVEAGPGLLESVFESPKTSGSSRLRGFA